MTVTCFAGFWTRACLTLWGLSSYTSESILRWKLKLKLTRNLRPTPRETPCNDLCRVTGREVESWDSNSHVRCLLAEGRSRSSSAITDTAEPPLAEAVCTPTPRERAIESCPHTGHHHRELSRNAPGYPSRPLGLISPLCRGRWHPDALLASDGEIDFFLQLSSNHALLWQVFKVGHLPCLSLPELGVRLRDTYFW
jgi:hypothetical protein